MFSRYSGLLTAPGEFDGLTADLENLIRVIKRLARKLADDHPHWHLVFPWRVLLTAMVSRLDSSVQWVYGADKHFPDIRDQQLLAGTCEGCHQSPTHDSQGNFDLALMNVRRCKVTRGSIGVPSTSS